MIKLIRSFNYPNLNRPKVIVGIGDSRIASNPHVLITYSLGSCVAIILYEPYKKLASLIHALLPSPRRMPVDNPYKYVETSIPETLNKLEKHGARKENIVAAVVGGASILKTTETLSIGKRNVETAKNTLKKLRIPIVAEDTGGTHSRTAIFDIATGTLYVVSPRLKLFR